MYTMPFHLSLDKIGALKFVNKEVLGGKLSCANVKATCSVLLGYMSDKNLHNSYAEK
jgi:hypothetical protein